MADWYYASDNKPMGPVSQAELKSLAAAGKLRASDLVWTDGMDDWTRAEKVNGLVFAEQGKQGPAGLTQFGVRSGPPAPMPAKRPFEPDVDAGPSDRSRRFDDDERPRRPDDEERSRRFDDDDDDVPRRRRYWDSDDRPLPRRQPSRAGGRKSAFIVILSVVGGFLAIFIIAAAAGLFSQKPKPHRPRPAPMVKLPPPAPGMFGQIRGDMGPLRPMPQPLPDHDLSSVAKAIRLEQAQITVQSELDRNDPVDLFWPKCFCKVYTYPMTAGESYVIELESNDFVVVLRLEDPHKAPLPQLQHAPTRQGSRTAEIFHTARETGDHRLIVTTLKEEATGKFTLRANPTSACFKKLPGEKDSSDATPIPLSEKQPTANGFLRDGDARALFRGRALCKVYTFPMVEGQAYEITMRSLNLDCYLRLEDPEQNFVDEDDDSGKGPRNQGTDALIVYTAAKSGLYRIIATSFLPGEDGAFTVNVRPHK